VVQKHLQVFLNHKS